MRQAGRYLPEYRAIRAAHSFLEVCRTPELAATVTIQPIQRFGFDAAIIFSDILVVLDAMGAGLTFDSRGPTIERPIRGPEDVAALRPVDAERDLGFVASAVRETVAVLPPSVPLFGFAGAPMTLLTYLMEGRGERAQTSARAMLMAHPALATELLDRLADAVADLLELQVRAGAQVIQLFDTWAGSLPVELWRRFAAPAARKVFDRLAHLEVPTLYFTRNTANVLDVLAEAGASAYGIGWDCDLAEARAALGPEVPVQGNLDPAVLLTTDELVHRHALQVTEAGGRRGHLFNLGHGVLPQTDPELVRILVETIQQFSYPEPKPPGSGIL